MLPIFALAFLVVLFPTSLAQVTCWPSAIGKPFCCPRAGPSSQYFLQLQQSSPSEILCDYSRGPIYKRCPYNVNTGSLLTSVPGCPGTALVNPYEFWCPMRGTVHPNFKISKCMDVRSADYTDGTPVQIYDCNGTGAQKWIFNRGRTQIQVAGTNFCLDATSSPANGVKVKIWQCLDIPAQRWSYAADNRFELDGTTFVLDLTDGNLGNWNQLQIWTRTPNNPNQVWSTY